MLILYFDFTAVILVIKRQMYSTLLEVTPVKNNYFWPQAIQIGQVRETKVSEEALDEDWVLCSCGLFFTGWRNQTSTLLVHLWSYIHLLLWRDVVGLSGKDVVARGAMSDRASSSRHREACQPSWCLVSVMYLTRGKKCCGRWVRKSPASSHAHKGGAGVGASRHWNRDSLQPVALCK